MNSQPRTRNWSTIGVIALVGLLFLVALFTNNSAPSRPFDPQSSAPDGLLLLRLWLEEMGYDARMQQQIGFNLPNVGQSLLLVYPGSRDFTESEAERLLQWIEAGNSVAFFLQFPVDEVLGSRFGFDLEDGYSFGEIKVNQPVIADHKELSFDQYYAESSLDLRQSQAVVSVVAAEEGKPQIAVQRMGKGTIWIFGSRISFNNEQLSFPGISAHFVPLLRSVSEGGIVQLDTYHLFGSLLADEQEITSVQGWLYYTAWGNATLFAALILGLYLVLQGRRLGPALPTQESLRRREAAEYVVAMANLYRRGDVTGDVTTYQKRRLKQALGHPLHLSSDLDDAAFVNALRAHDPHIDAELAEKVSKLLHSLDRSDDSSLIASAAEIDQLLKDLRR